MQPCWKQNTFYLLLHSNSPVKAQLTNHPAFLSIMLPITTLKRCSGPSSWTLLTIQASLSKRQSVSVCQMLQDFWRQWQECSRLPISISVLSGGREITQWAPLPEAREGDAWIKECRTFLPAWPFPSCNWTLRGWLKRGQFVPSRCMNSSHPLNGTIYEGLSLQT